MEGDIYRVGGREWCKDIYVFESRIIRICISFDTAILKQDHCTIFIIEFVYIT